jgi:glycosyltransferase involved in cell wall biosynthesis
MKTLLVVLAWNEAENLPPLIRELQRLYPECDVLVVNDGSTDRSGEVATACGVRVANLPFNLGIGIAEATGFLYAEQNGYDRVVRLDGDGQHPPAEISTLLHALENSRVDMLIGSRFLCAGGFRSSRLRRLGIYWLAFLNTILIHQRITDSTSGFRAYQQQAFKFLAHHNPSDYPEPESIILMARNGFSIREVPVVMRERQEGKSSISGLQTIYYMVKTTLALLITAIRQPIRPVDNRCQSQ